MSIATSVTHRAMCNGVEKSSVIKTCHSGGGEAPDRVHRFGSYRSPLAPSRTTPLSSIVFRLSSIVFAILALVRLIRQAHRNSQDETTHANRFAHSRASRRISSSPSTCRPRITNLPLHITESIALEFAE